MRQYERGGVVVDQCGECRGIFLDRGELDHLINAENQWSSGQATAGRSQPAPRQDDRRYDDQRYDDRGHEQRPYDDDRRYTQRPYDDKYRQKKKRKSFFEDLFDD
jgi:Zn-finger nucleic acid-binding protein